ncbi:MAG: 5-formyltetrahydrofolate cyclo-ligase [Candidatus Eiseniibacteriota bacterium]
MTVPEVEAAKAALRTEAKARRTAACRALGANGATQIGTAIRDRFLATLKPAARIVVGSYWPFGDEVDTRPLLHHLHDLGHVCAVAAVVARGRPLKFRRWHPGQAFVAGTLGEPAPPPEAPEEKPELLLVPLLAFDRRGYRLGYGGGYFDRTIAVLRAAPDMAGVGGVLAVGVAYAAQEIAMVPTERHDQRLDWIVTERETIRPGP